MELVAELKKIQGAFAVVHKPGDICIIPAGYLVVTYRPESTTGLRWSFSHRVNSERVKIMKAVGMAVASYPGLRQTMYWSWFQALEGMKL